MAKQVKVLVAGLGSRWTAYQSFVKRYPDDMKIVGIADMSDKKLKEYGEWYDIPEENRFHDALEMFKAGIEADGAIICTLDHQHHEQSIAAMRAGYHIILEKPVAIEKDHCREIRDVAHETGRSVVVCHELRYTPFYQKIKQTIDSGAIGDILTIQAMERVEYWHQAHGFVRGNWRNTKDSCPMILSKSCHDTDILSWLCGKKCVRLSSFGSLKHFTKANKPEGAAERCLECKYVNDCPYSAKHEYIDRVAGGYNGWPIDVVQKNATVESITEELKTNSYGKCVYDFDNDVVDHQIVNMWMEDDVAISFIMSTGNSKSGRTITVMGTHGEIIGDFGANTLEINVFGKSSEKIDVSKLGAQDSGHGGGDFKMLMDFVEIVRNGGTTGNTTYAGIDSSVDAHLISFAAEDSRLQNGKVIEMAEYDS